MILFQNGIPVVVESELRKIASCSPKSVVAVRRKKEEKKGGNEEEET